MIVQIVMVFHLIAVVKIIIFARARVVTLENVSLIVQVYTWIHADVIVYLFAYLHMALHTEENTDSSQLKS